MKHDEIRDEIGVHNPDAIVYDPKELDHAIIGMSGDGCVVYSYEKLMGIFMTINKDWSEIDAEEWLSYNVVGSHLGKYNPVVVYDLHY